MHAEAAQIDQRILWKLKGDDGRRTCTGGALWLDPEPIAIEAVELCRGKAHFVGHDLHVYKGATKKNWQTVFTTSVDGPS